ncbi:MAG: N4-(beta-N-acetylglucosaminyl)-L-asparaginase, partial [Ulvibacter sp.]
MKRRKFIQNASLTGIGVVAGTAAISCKDEKNSEEAASSSSNSAAMIAATPVVIATWNVPASTAKAWEALQEGKSALEAVEQGCMV